MKGEVLKLATERASVRDFSDEPVSKKDIIYGIETARHAPSGANQQPWLYVLVTDPRIKERIREECEKLERELHKNPPPNLKEFLASRKITWRKEFLTEAPALILIFGDSTKPYWVQSVWLSVGYLLLALQEKGLASLTYTPPKTKWVNELLQIPKNYILQSIVPVGKPRTKPEALNRKPLDQIMKQM